MKVSKIEITAIEMAYKLYVKGHGLTHAVRMANEKVSEVSKIMEKDDKELLTTSSRLSRKVKQNNVTHYYSKATAPEQIKDIQREYQKGKSVSSLARIYGLSRGTIYSYLEFQV